MRGYLAKDYEQAAENQESFINLFSDFFCEVPFNVAIEKVSDDCIAQMDTYIETADESATVEDVQEIVYQSAALTKLIVRGKFMLETYKEQCHERNNRFSAGPSARA